MNMLKLFSSAAALGILFLIAIPAQADDIQDANKLFKQGLNTQAMDKVNAFLATKPKDAQARFLKGLILADQGNTADAITVFSNLTQDYPELPEPYNNLAVLYAGQGQYEKAKEQLEMAIRTNPTYATAHENLGDIYAKMASQAYDRALQLEKSGPNSSANANTKTKLALIRELFSKNPRTAAKPAASVTAEAASASAVAASAPVAVSAAAVATSVAAAISAPASAPVVTSVQAKPVVAVAAISADPSAELLNSTKDWAAAWSAKNSKKYLAFYAKDFKTPDGSSRSAWEAQRKQRIAAPKSIRVEVRDAKVKVVDDKHASVSFKQTYRASHLNVVSNKTLNWEKADGQWLIAEERSGK
ncbi:tetratricopeptide repeat protein [Sideroxydans sp. CL21]|uniref:nuclear transport factor 2 family protein n=1 Tax=Sideroxydans sp. CL21 TaxID=2600596 RepID=UPI0024BC13E0|nr:tetratricopeptide repeat protein [Sideroxydans sp. CL21]